MYRSVLVIAHMSCIISFNEQRNTMQCKRSCVMRYLFSAQPNKLVLVCSTMQINTTYVMC